MELAWRPVVLDPGVDADAAELARLRAAGAVREEHDTIAAQLLDLVRVRSPAMVDEGKRSRAVELLLDGRHTSTYGRQVYYPWSGRLVHLLPPTEFDEVRLDRNRHKVTRAEQARLRRGVVAVVGLSVGNAVALTLAQEGACGSLVLADFDRLDLSNMNRLRAAVHEIGLPKTVIAARQIAEIDPYLDVVAWHDGVTEANVEALLAGPPRLDVLVDECDGLLLKFLMRTHARALGIPVVMETSDRGMLDVERFDQEPGRPLFHGLVPEIPVEMLRAPDLATKARVVLDVIGGATMSARFGASLAEIGRTICSWPQLASDVALGGASVTVAVRKILLGEPLPSGRKLVDLQEVASGDARTPRPPRGAERPAPLPPRGLAHPEEAPAAEPEHPVTRHMLLHASLAPSAGNAQPWHFHHDGATAWIRMDEARAVRELDPRRRAALTAIGAAIENAVVAAAERGHAVELCQFPIPDRPDVVARLDLVPAVAAGLREDARLFPFVAARTTNRRAGVRSRIPDADRAALEAAARERGGVLELADDPRHLAELAQVAAESERIYVTALASQAAGELRLDPADASRGDGIDLATLELDPAASALLRVATRPDVAAALRAIEGGQSLGEPLRRAIAEGTSAAGLLWVEGDGTESSLAAGRALQRVWLTATSLGLAFQPVAGPLALMGALQRGTASGILSEAERATVQEMLPRLQACFPGFGRAMPAMVFRLFEAPPPSARAVRLPLRCIATRGSPA